MRALIADADLTDAGVVIDSLEQLGFAVAQCADAASALRKALATEYDLIVVDIQLPGSDGCALVRQLRAENATVPLLVASSRGSTEDRIRGLNAGADQYVVKPFAKEELLAHIHATLRRHAGPSSCRLSAGNLHMDLLTREVSRAGERIELRPHEFLLLEVLLRHCGHVVSRSTILRHVWHYSFDPRTNVVDVLVCRLRRQIDRDWEEKMIHTVRGAGYALRVVPSAESFRRRDAAAWPGFGASGSSS